MASGIYRGNADIGSAIKSHYDRIVDAIRTGNMDNVKRANQVGYNNEKSEVREYARMKK